MAECPVQKVALHCPSLEEAAGVIEDGLKQNFADVSVTVVDCPDLTQKPFMIAAPGLCGSPSLADIGGVPYMVPTPQMDKYYNLEEMSRLTELPNGLFVGAGAGPHRTIGVNCEMMVNFKASEERTKSIVSTWISKVNEQDGSCSLEKIQSTDFALLCNLFCSEGKQGKVLEIKAKKRTGPTCFPSCIRETLSKKYGNKAVGLGGTFLVKEGKAKLHNMPRFSSKPLLSDDDINEWLKFFNMPAPLVCIGVLISHDPDLDLRLEHFHCYSDHGDGGHYHYDTTPDEVEYLGYFNIAEHMYRIDRPKQTHQIGRD